mgnify:CR=1 FL=1
MLNVLLVDDDSEFSDVVCHIVEFLGHNINTAANTVTNNFIDSGKRTFRLTTASNLKIGEIYYFDHPAFGVLMYLSKIKE